MNHPILHNNKKFYQMLNEMFSPEWLETTARDVGLIKRERKVDPVTLFWVLVLGFGIGFQRTLASLRRAYETVSAKKLAPSAFYDRFTPQLAAFFRECLAHGIADLAGQGSLALSEKLQGFKDIIVSDGTVIKLHDQLASQFPGTRGKAELKISTPPSGSRETPRVSPSIPAILPMSRPCVSEIGLRTTSFFLILGTSSTNCSAGSVRMMVIS